MERLLSIYIIGLISYMLFASCRAATRDDLSEFEELWQALKHEMDRSSDESFLPEQDEWSALFVEQERLQDEEQEQKKVRKQPLMVWQMEDDEAQQEHQAKEKETEVDIFGVLRQSPRPKMGPRRVSNMSRTSSTGSRRGRKLRDEDPDIVRPHRCQECGDRFLRNEHLFRHIRTVHSDENPFPCGVCGKSYSREDNRNIHSSTCHASKIRQD